MNYENQVTMLLKFRARRTHGRRNITTRLISIEIAPTVYHPGQVSGRVLRGKVLSVVYAGSEKETEDTKGAGAPRPNQDWSMRSGASYADTTCVGGQVASRFNLSLAECSYSGSL